MILQTIDELTCPDFQQRIFVVANFASEGAAPHVRFGSKAEVTPLDCDVRFTSENGHSPTRLGCLLWAISRLVQCSVKLIHAVKQAITSRCSKLNTVQPGALKIFVDMHQ